MARVFRVCRGTLTYWKQRRCSKHVEVIEKVVVLKILRILRIINFP